MNVEYKKITAVMIWNDKRELALQLRAAKDDSFPSHWDFSAGGGIDLNEDEKVAATRELQEELGVKADVTFVTKEHYTYPSWNPSITRESDIWIYTTKHNGPFTPDTTEVEKVEFFTLKKIGEMMKSGVKFHPEFILSWDKEIVSQASKGF